MRRTFSPTERFALYMAADGKCQLCGKPLGDVWHADHVQPYSKGGETDVINGQALCPECNLRKGDSSMPGSIGLPEWSKPLREWQENARLKYLGDAQENWLVVATPGAGKTTFCLRIAYDLLVSGRIERIVVVVPSDHLCKQWAYAAHEYGISLTPDWKNSSGPLPYGFVGAVVTYAQLAANGAVSVRWLVSRAPTLAIIDEIHHAGDDNAWGDALRAGLEPAVRRLSASGTPFRSDNNPIPYVVYDDGKSVSDYNYGYGEALRDGVCRVVFFPTFEGEMEWLSSSGNIVTATFEDMLPERERRERLNTAISTQGDWLPDVIKAADPKLLDIHSNSQADAKGLIVCKDMVHARATAKLVKKLTGEEPDVAVSDDPKASDVIKRFGAGSKRWLVAVKMVSEGVDIPNLRVGIYATNIVSELYFRQFIGRFVRMQPDIEDQSAYVYIPRDPDLLQYAAAVKDERDHFLEEEIERVVTPPEPKEPGGERVSMFMPISSIGIEHNTMDVEGHEYMPEAIKQAASLRQRLGLSISDEIIAMIIRETGTATPQPERGEAHSPVTQSTDPEFIRVKKLRDVCSGLARKYSMITGRDFWYPHQLWVEQHNGNKQENAGADELERKQRWLIGLVKDAKNGRR